MVLLGFSIPLVNFMLCFAIISLGIFWYKENKNTTALLIAFSFGFFGLSHLLDLLSISTQPLIMPLLLFLRLTGYSILIAIILRDLTNKKYPLFLMIGTTFLFTILIINIKFFENAILIQLTNLLFSLEFALLAFLAYKKNSNFFNLYMGVAYIFFSASHIAFSLKFQETFTAALVILRIIAYIIVLSTIYSLAKKGMSNFILKYLTNVKVQTTIVCITMGILAILFYFPHLKFNYSDPKPQIYSIQPTITEKQITKVKTGLYIKNFPLFDITNNDFIIDAILWFEFDPHAISLDTIKKFSFEKGTIISTSEPETKIINDKLFSSFKISVKFKSDLDYRLFPLEDHKINILLTNTFLNPEEVVLSSRNADLSSQEQIFTGDWIMTGGEVDYGYFKSEITKYEPQKTSTYPAVIFSLEFKKAGIKKTLIIFIPLFIAFFLSLFSLVISLTNASGILSLSVGSITSLIINLFTVEKMTPNVRYFTLSDIIFNILLFSVFTIFILNIYLMKQVKKEVISKNLILLRSYIFLFFIIVIPLIIYYLLY